MAPPQSPERDFAAASHPAGGFNPSDLRLSTSSPPVHRLSIFPPASNTRPTPPSARAESISARQDDERRGDHAGEALEAIGYIRGEVGDGEVEGGAEPLLVERAGEVAAVDERRARI